MQRGRLRLLACLVVMAFIGSAPGSAAAFGTIDTGGQRREHERVTRAALSCAGEAHADEEPALKRRRARQPRSTAAVELHHYRRMSAPAKTASKAGELAVPARRALAFATATATLTRTPQRGTSPTSPTTRMQGETGQGEAEPAR